jgi:glyoxylase-like metal-dependent hydrolase (beta-lactamase superfamily II)
MQVQEVATGIFEISLAWSNAYLLVEGETAALIDTGLSKDRESLLAALRQVSLTEHAIRAVYLTHGHCDHAGNAAYLAGYGAVVHAHKAEARMLGLPRRTYVPTGWQRLTRLPTSLAFTLGERLYPVERRQPDILLEDGDTLQAPGGPLRVVASPGHTPGHIALYREQDSVLFSGDAILNVIPVKRVTGLSLPMGLFTENMRQARNSARQLATLRPNLLLSGHGWPLQGNTAVLLESWAASLG